MSNVFICERVNAMTLDIWRPSTLCNLELDPFHAAFDRYKPIFFSFRSSRMDFTSMLCGQLWLATTISMVRSLPARGNCCYWTWEECVSSSDTTCCYGEKLVTVSTFILVEFLLLLNFSSCQFFLGSNLKHFPKILRLNFRKTCQKIRAPDESWLVLMRMVKKLNSNSYSVTTKSSTNRKSA